MRLSTVLLTEDLEKRGDLSAAGVLPGECPQNLATGMPGGKKRVLGRGIVIPTDPIAARLMQRIAAANAIETPVSPGQTYQLVPVPAQKQAITPKPAAKKIAPQKPDPQQQNAPEADEPQEAGPSSKTVSNMAVLKHHGFQKWGGGEYLHPKNGSVGLNKDDGSWTHKDEQGQNTHKGVGGQELHEYLDSLEQQGGQPQQQQQGQPQQGQPQQQPVQQQQTSTKTQMQGVGSGLRMTSLCKAGQHGKCAGGKCDCPCHGKMKADTKIPGVIRTKRPK